MPKHSSPFDEEVYREWLRISIFADPVLPVDEQRAVWQTLFDRTNVDGQWRCNAYSASLVTSKGIEHALADRRLADAEHLARLFLALGRSTCDRVDWGYHWSRLGTTLLLQGRDEEAFAHWDSFVPYSPMDTRLALLHLRLDLLLSLEGLGHEEEAPAALQEFVSRFLARWKGHKRDAKAALVAQTNGDLADLINRTYPKQRCD